MSEIDLMAELDDPCPRGCGRSADECDEAEDGEDCAGSPLVRELEDGMAKRFRQIQARDRTIAELGVSNASLIRRVANLENQLAEAQRDETAAIEDRDEYHDIADKLAAAIARLTGLAIGEHSSMNDPWDNALVFADQMLRQRDAYDAAGKGETDDAAAKSAVTSRGLAMHAVLSDVIDERYRQDAKWGQSNHADGTGPDWRLFGSSALDQATRSGFAMDAHGGIREIQAPGTTWMLIALKQIFGVFVETDPAMIRSKLIRVAAVAVAWAEAIDRRADSRAGQAGGEDK